MIYTNKDMNTYLTHKLNIMKYIKKYDKSILFFITNVLLFFPLELLAQGPPPPPGVPLDFGLSALIAACLGYGVKRVYDSNKK
jgi:hypothetical protein